jgi:hypothetical protein
VANSLCCGLKPAPVVAKSPLPRPSSLRDRLRAKGRFAGVFAIGILTAAVAMAVSVRVGSTTLLVAGTFILFGYVGAAVARYHHQSLGLPATLAICGVLFACLAVIVARVPRPTGRGQADRAGPTVRSHQVERAPSGLHSAQRDLEHSTSRRHSRESNPSQSSRSQPNWRQPSGLIPSQRSSSQPSSSGQNSGQTTRARRQGTQRPCTGDSTGANRQPSFCPRRRRLGP